jgi:hypothetical protein
MNRLSLACAAAALSAPALFTSPAVAGTFHDGVTTIQWGGGGPRYYDNGPGGNWGYHYGRQRWDGRRDWDGRREWDGPRGHGNGYAYGRRCRVEVVTRYSNRFGGYVRRPVEVCG